MDDFEIRKRELLQPLLFEAGAGLMDCQSFEFSIALLLFHWARLGTVDLDSAKMELILNNTDKKTAGQLIVLLRKHLAFSEEIDRGLTEALAARNELIHRVLIDNIEFLVSDEDRTKLVKYIRKLRRKIAAANQSLHPFISMFNEALDDVRQVEVEAEVRKFFGRRSVEPQAIDQSDPNSEDTCVQR